MNGVKKLPKDRREKHKPLNRDFLKTALKISQLEGLSLPHLEADGNRELLIEGCKGIIAYEQGKISLNTGKLVVTVIGDGIEIKVFCDTETVIEGDIMTISFENLQGERYADY